MEDNKPHIVNRADFTPTKEYIEWLRELRSRLQGYQAKVAVKVNTAMLEFYWELGRDIVNKQAETAWGSGFLKQLSLDLRSMFPSIAGFSVSNLQYIRKWYIFYSQSDTIQHQVGVKLKMPEKFGLVPWRHHVEIVIHCKDIGEAIFYIDRTIEGNWSRRKLEDAIAGGLYGRTGKAVSNFSDKLPEVQGRLALEVLKDPYNFDFLTLREGYEEKDLEDALAHNISRFLLELGKGFAFVGRQMELRMPGGQSFFPDMVFYHTKLKCYIVLELKVVPFIPEFAGKLNFYVTAADELLRDESDRPSIGLLICKSKDDTVVKWSFRNIDSPIGVAAYANINEIENLLPTPEEIEAQIKHI